MTAEDTAMLVEAGLPAEVAEFANGMSALGNPGGTVGQVCPCARAFHARLGPLAAAGATAGFDSGLGS